MMVKIALIGVLGIGAQWIAWRTGRPAIALMLIVGVIAGPVLGLIRPEEDFGPLMEPIVKLAVAVILFEGGLSLNFRDLRHAGAGVLRLVVIGVPVGWGLGTAAAYYGAGLPLPVAALFGGILVVTGPTVIGPMLRTLRVGDRVRNILKWEGIINDPIGALLAVGIYAYISYTGPQVDFLDIGIDVVGATVIAALLGGALGWFLTWAFPRGYAPEYLKAPILLITVIFGFVAADLVMHESGLVTVTVMGVVMANRAIYSSHALHRFKEDLAVLLISGVFILLSATLDWETVSQFQVRFVAFLFLLLFVVRPLTVFTSLMFSSVPWRERIFIGWIAPRGIVAVAITGLFAIRLVDYGVEDAEALVPLSFGVVIVTIFAHGFSASWLARRLGIDEGKGEGLLLVGANRWTIALAQFFKERDIPVMIADSSAIALRDARRADIEIYRGDILDEVHEDELSLGNFQHLIAATDNDSYNALVANDLGPEMGHDAITRIGQDVSKGVVQKRGRILLQTGRTIDELLDRLQSGWSFSRTRITEKFSVEDYRENLKGNRGESVAVIKPDKRVLFFSMQARPVIEIGDQIVSFVAPEDPRELMDKREEPRETKAETKKAEAKKDAG
ncbi:MAG: sodium:proton antiporter [Sphingomonadales bacterium]|nr:sodium:proton antiporter [Sphingomonadales bacterium]